MNKDYNIANIKNSVEEKSLSISGDHWLKNLVRMKKCPNVITNAKCYPFLVKIFEENGGFADNEKLDQIEVAIGGRVSAREFFGQDFCLPERARLFFCN